MQNRMCSVLINTAVKPTSWTLFSDSGEFLKHARYEIAGKEFDELLPTLHGFLRENNESIHSVLKMFVVTGPISFTGGRIVTLTATTLALVHDIELIPLTIFDFWKMLGNAFPMAIEANKEEVVECDHAGAEWRLVPKGKEYATWEASRFGLPNSQNSIQWDYDASQLYESLALLTPTKKLEPIYLKKPNITLPTK